MTLGALTLDSARRRGIGIRITPREYELLEYLIRRHDQIVTKREILDNVWDSSFERGDNVMEVYIGYLRRKIDIPFGIHSLTPVRGTGYLLRGRTGASGRQGPPVLDGES
ncbi:winged helix-turn-helix domain-containing protein [Arthrobacter sp. 49Tsu3.1M3]|uniref:winged helix-turn-helix domain-containing protein n=1 Tax=Arthrobacter sp. 49Tsu3.1M3 TaxID=1279029 RepID=UPI0021173FB6|nr:winged helix-turn-helix domain-containing protein [Arthrobacter sp. 49Tsu3.1M3]